MEQFYDYRMIEERSVVEQAHEIQSFARELEHFSCMLLDNLRSKKEQKEYKEFEQLFSVPVHCNHSDSHVIENIQNNRGLCISAIHMSEPIFISQLRNKEKMDRRC